MWWMGVGRNGQLARLALTLAFASLVACTPGPGATPSAGVPGEPPPAPHGAVVFGSLSEPVTLNPLTASDEASRWASELVFDGLLRSNEQLGVAGKLASDYRGSPDGLIYTVWINTTAVWHDGAPVTVDDVKFTYDLLLDPTTPTIDKTPFSRLARVEVVDARTLRFVLRQPDAALPSALTVGIVPRHLYAGRDLRDPELARHPVGNGAFRFDAWSGDGRLTFSANPTYYFVPGARLEHVVWQRYVDETALAEAARRGEVDAVDTLPPVAARLRVDLGWRPFGWQAGVRRLVFQTARPALAPLAVRQALAYAIDRRPMLGNATTPSAVAATSDMPPGIWAAFDSATVNRYPYSPDRARALLSEVPSGPPASVEVLLDQADRELAATAAVVADGWRTVGVEAHLAPLPPDELARRLAAGDFDAALLSEPVLADPDLSRRYHTDALGRGNVSRFSQPEIDRLLDLGLATTTAPERTRVYHRLQEKLAQELPALPLYAPLRVLAVQPDVTGPLPSPRDPLWNADRWQLISWSP